MVVLCAWRVAWAVAWASGECHVDLRLASHSSPPGQKSKIKSKSSSPKDPPSSGSLCGLIIDGINETIGGEVKEVQ